MNLQTFSKAIEQRPLKIDLITYQRSSECLPVQDKSLHYQVSERVRKRSKKNVEGNASYQYEDQYQPI